MRTVWRLTFPLFIGYVPLAIAFAVAWLQAGLPAWGAVFASVFLYAGSMQFLLIGLLAAGVGLDTVLVAALAVNLRHIFYGLSFPAAPFAGHPAALAYCAFALTDEAYSIVNQNDPKDGYKPILLACALLHIFWVGGTVLGLAAGALIPNSVIGFDFALCGVFTVLAQNHYYRKTRRPALALGFIGISLAFLAVYGFGVDKNKLLAIAIVVLTVLLFVLPREKVLPEART